MGGRVHRSGTVPMRELGVRVRCKGLFHRETELYRRLWYSAGHLLRGSFHHTFNTPTLPLKGLTAWLLRMIREQREEEWKEGGNRLWEVEAERKWAKKRIRWIKREEENEVGNRKWVKGDKKEFQNKEKWFYFICLSETFTAKFHFFNFVFRLYLCCPDHHRWEKAPSSMPGCWTNWRPSVSVVSPSTSLCGSLRPANTMWPSSMPLDTETSSRTWSLVPLR